MDLQDQLDSLTAKLRAMVPAERLAIVDSAAEELARSGIASLRSAISLLHSNSPTATACCGARTNCFAAGRSSLSFIADTGCAYCNAQLSALQKIHPEIAEAGASLVAISPQTQKHSYMTRDMHKLRFPVLSDQGNQLARKGGLVSRLSPELQAMYESTMTKLPGYNGDQNWELPLAATYIVQPDGKISYARVDADWRHRPEPEQLLRVVTDSMSENGTA